MQPAFSGENTLRHRMLHSGFNCSDGDAIELSKSRQNLISCGFTLKIARASIGLDRVIEFDDWIPTNAGPTQAHFVSLPGRQIWKSVQPQPGKVLQVSLRLDDLIDVILVSCLYLNLFFLFPFI